MLVVFGVMSCIVCPESLADNAVNVFGFLDVPVLAHDHHIGLDEVFLETGCLAEKSLDYFSVILCKHCWYRIPFCRELEDAEVIIVLAQAPLTGLIVNV